MSGKHERRPYTPYTDEQIQFLQDNIQGMSYPKLAELFNQRYGTSIGRLTISKVCRRRGLTNGRPTRRPYTTSQIKYLRKNAKGRPYDELAAMFNRHFNTEVTARIVGEICRS